MNVLNKVTWSAMWKNRTRTIVTIIGIILSAAMFTAVTTLGVSVIGYLVDCVVYTSGDYFVRFDYSTDAQLAELHQEEAVSRVGDLRALGYTTFELPARASSETCILAAGDEDFFDMVTVPLEEGRLPEASDEIVITRNIYYYLQQAGMPCEVGETVTLDVVPEYVPEEGENDLDLPASGAAFQKSYRIVGISEYFTRLGDDELHRSHLFTRSDGTENALWHRLFVKTSPPMAAYELQSQPYGMVSSSNSELLALYGASRYTNYNHFIYGMCAAIMAIILIGSVSLIYNAFSISVSERTKQFGLLSSVGATKRQLRKSVYFEALTLSGIGVPLGILCGYFGIAVTLHFTGGLVDDLMAGAVEGNISLVAIPSLPAFLCAGVVAVWTVLISAWLPARRATSLSPITAIRQNQDIQIPKRGLKGKLTPSRISQNLARKYNQVNARKYRSTVVSLTISIVLFLTSASLSADLRNTVKSNANTYNFDFDITISDLAQGEEIRNLDCVGQSAYAHGRQEMTVIPDEAFTPEYVSQWETAMETWYREESINLKQAYMIYLEDAVLLDHLTRNGIDPEPYFRKETPTALVMASRFQMLTETEQGYEMISYSADMLKDNSPLLSLYTNACPEEVFEFVEPRIGGHRWDISMMDGMPVYEYQCTIAEVTEELVASDPWIWPDGSIRFAMKNLDDGDFGFFLIDPDTGMPNEVPTGSVPNTVPVQEVHLGETLRELPFGCPGYSGAQDIVLLMPLSLYPGEEVPDLLVKTTDYRKMKEYLDTNGISYLDHMETEVQYRNMVTMINVFSYGFIILISLVCVCNIFNTVSTNIALRRRDFGMLRSIGMEERQIRRMLFVECFSYGRTALLIGIPLGLLCGWGLLGISYNVEEVSYTLPLAELCVAVGTIFLVIFASMAYALSKLKKDDPIEAIRMENI